MGRVLVQEDVKKLSSDYPETQDNLYVKEINTSAISLREKKDL